VRDILFVAGEPSGDLHASAVARELGVTQANARVIRHRALLKLRECIGMSDGAP